jgi:hypothetical protein
MKPCPAASPIGVALALLLLAVACSDVPADERTGILAPDGSEEVFGPVADYLGHRCGTGDCHGDERRNFRIWSCKGLRLVTTDVVECSRARGGRRTSPEEHLATYRSLVTLEPAVMTEVVAGGGTSPELLTFYRKARGIETHTGGQLVFAGDVQDVCITSWLSGVTNLTACANALQFPAFEGFPPLP